MDPEYGFLSERGIHPENTEWPKKIYTHFGIQNITL